ncbi:MAG TPA: hypothetical protein VJX67_15435 [Blastocatellia bacterium]|nr:hypothetical protein [Blastocatellia bacterium]
MLRLTMPLWLLLIVLSVSMVATPVQAQTSPGVNFSVNPAIFATGQASSAFLCLSAASSKQLATGDKFVFSFGPTIGAVTSVSLPVSVSSSTLLATDFSASANTGLNQVTITYNGPSQSFGYGNSICVKVNFTASAQVGAGDVSLSSRFTQSVNGTVPFQTVSIVNFATGPSGSPGPPGPPGPPGAPGTPAPVTFASSHDLTSGGLQENVSLLNISSSFSDMPGFTGSFSSGDPSVTLIPNTCMVTKFAVSISTPQTVSGTTLTFTLRAGTFVTFDPTNLSSVSTDVSNTPVTCSITGASQSCSATAVPFTISAGSLVDVLLTVTPQNTQVPNIENVQISIACQ